MRKIMILTLLISLVGIMVAQNVVLDENFETGGTTWTISNGSFTNRWVIGTAPQDANIGTPHGGSGNSIYISDTAAGSSHQYALPAQGTVFFYRNVTFPTNAEFIVLTFDLLANGESVNDRVRVYLYPETDPPPVASSGDYASTTNRIGEANYNRTFGQWVTHTITIPNTHAGETRRLIFNWRNNTTVANQPPAAIDNIKITTYTASTRPYPAIVSSPANNAMDRANLQRLVWNAPAGGQTPAGYKLRFGTTANLTDTHIVYEGENTFWISPNPLAFGTQYYWQVIPFNTAGDATETPVWTFTTASLITGNDPYTQNFDASFLLPRGWSSLVMYPTGAPTNSHLDINSQVTPVHSPPNALRLHKASTNAANTMAAFTPPIQNITSKRVKFHLRVSAASARLHVGTYSDPTTFVLLAEIANTTINVNTPHTVNLTEATNEHLVFLYGVGDSSIMYIDDVIIENIPQGADFASSHLGINFGQFLQTQTASASVTYTNHGTASLTINHTTLPQGISASHDPVTIAEAGGSQVVTYTLSPAGAGQFSGNIVLSTNATNATSFILSSTALVFAPLQGNTIEVGTGTTTASSGILPIPSNQGHSYTQSIYRPIDLGYQAGAIASIAYHWNGNAAVSEDITIYMGNIADVNHLYTANNYITEGLQEVFQGTINLTNQPIGPLTNWIDIPLQTPFIHNPAQSLVVAVYSYNGNAYGTASAFNQHSVTGNRSISNSANTALATVPPASGTVRANLPNTRFTFGVPGQPYILVSPHQIDFPQTMAGVTTTTNMLIHNPGDSTLEITSIIYPPLVTASHNGAFSIFPGESVTVELALVSPEPRDFTGTITIHSNGSNQVVLTREVTALIEIYRETLWEETFDPLTPDTWTIVNSTHVNGWSIGTAPAANNTNSIYISSDTGTSHTYNGTGTNRVHFWRYVTFPSDIANIILRFDMLCLGQTNFDFLRVYLFDDDFEVEASTGHANNNASEEPFHSNSLGGSPTSGSYNLLNGTTNSLIQTSGTVWTPITLDIPVENSGTTKKLVFTWRQNATSAADPPAAIDNIRILYAGAPNPPLPAVAIAPPHGTANIFIDTAFSWALETTSSLPSGFLLRYGTEESFPTSNPVPLGAEVRSWTPPVELQGETQYFWEIVPFNGYGPAEDCPIWSFTTAHPGLVQIGYGSLETGSIPWNPNFQSTISQTIYYPTEINKSPGDVITHLYYHFNGNGPITDPIKVYMGHTDRDVYTGGNSWVPFTDLHLVFDGQTTTTAAPASPYTNWLAIELDDVFIYAPSEEAPNLVIGIIDNGGWNYTIYDAFFQETTEGNRSLYRSANFTDHPNDHPPDIYALLGGTTVPRIPNTRLLFENATDVSALTFSPATINFGINNLGTPATQAIKFSNVGSGSLSISAIELPPNITRIPEGAININQDGSAEVLFILTPSEEGVYENVISITTNAGISQATIIPVSGYTLAENVIQIGNGSSGLEVPLQPSRGYSYSQSIYYAADMNNRGSIISGLQYHFSGFSVISENIQIYLGSTNRQAFPGFGEPGYGEWIPLSEMTLVFEGTITTTNMPSGPFSNWIEIPFDTEFNHTAGANLAIAVYSRNGIAYAGENFFKQHTVTPNYRTQIHFSNTMFTIEEAVGGLMRDFIPNTRIVFGAPIEGSHIIVTPAQITFPTTSVNSATTTSLTISNVGYESFSVTALVLPPEITTNTATPFDVSPNQERIVELTLFTSEIGNYTAEIEIISTANNTPIVSKPVFAFIEPFRFVLWEEDFEAGAEQWTIVNGQATNKWFHGSAAMGNNTGSMYISSAPLGSVNPPHSYQTNDFIDGSRTHFYRDAVFPVGATDIRLTFDLLCRAEVNQGYMFDWLRVYLHNTSYTPVAIQGNQPSASVPREPNQIGLDAYANTPGWENNEWTNYTIDLLNAPSESRFVFTWRNDATDVFNPPAAIDNIRVLYALPGAPAPSPQNLSAFASGSSISLNWQAPIDVLVDPLGYRIYKDNSPIAQIFEDNVFSFEDTDVINGLTYNYYVVAIYPYGDSSPSNTVTVLHISLIAPPANLGYTIQGDNVVLTWEYGRLILDENFEDATLNPAFINFDQNNDGFVWEITDIDPAEGEQALMSRSMHPDGTTPLNPDNWLISPIISPTANTYFSYWIGASSDTDFSESYTIRMSQGGSVPANFTMILHSETLNTGEWQRRSIPLGMQQGNQIRIAIVHNTIGGQSALKLDGLQVVVPTPEPTRAEFSGFKIYKDGTLFHTITDDTRTFTDTNVATGVFRYYVTTNYGQFGESHPGNVLYVSTVPTEDHDMIPFMTELKGNYPNPFNPETTIRFTIGSPPSVRGDTGGSSSVRGDTTIPPSMRGDKGGVPVRIDIYNIKGQRVMTLVDEIYKPGTHTILWKGVDAFDRPVASGIYFYRMRTDSYSAVKRMMLVK